MGGHQCGEGLTRYEGSGLFKAEAIPIHVTRGFVMRTPLACFALILAALVPSGTLLLAQSTPPSTSGANGFGAEILQQFEASTAKLQALAEAMPADHYDWSPGEGVMPVAQVYMHIARYNYMYPETSMGVPAPTGVDQASMESVRDKARVVEMLGESIEHVRAVAAEMSEEDLAERTVLYGRDVAKWAVLLQLVTHMNEHLGQSIAYARMNGVVPPWSM